MKKRMSKILSILLVSALVVSTGSVVRAEDVGGPATEVQTAGDVASEASGKFGAEAEIISEQAAGAQVLEPMDVSGEVKDISAKATVAGSIPLNKIVTGAETTADAGEIIYYNTSSFKKSGNYYGYGQAVSLTKGTLLLTVASDPNSTHSTIFGLYKDSNLTQAVDSYASVSRGGTYQRMFKVPSKATYYIGVYSSMASAAAGSAAVRLGVVAQFFNGEDRTLTSGKQVAVGVKDAQTTYFKFKATKTGYIRAYGDSTASYYSVALFNSKKKALSGTTSLKYSPVYGVKQGTTYYIRVKSSYNSSGGYAFKVTNTKLAVEKNGTKKTNAVVLKRKATKKGIIQAGSSSRGAVWYKFKKTNKNKTVITVKGATNDTFRVTVSGPGKTAKKDFKYYSGGVRCNLINYPKGTYYVKIQRVNKKSSGYYSVSWK